MIHLRPTFGRIVGGWVVSGPAGRLGDYWLRLAANGFYRINDTTDDARLTENVNTFVRLSNDVPGTHGIVKPGAFFRLYG